MRWFWWAVTAISKNSLGLGDIEHRRSTQEHVLDQRGLLAFLALRCLAVTISHQTRRRQSDDLLADHSPQAVELFPTTARLVVMATDIDVAAFLVVPLTLRRLVHRLLSRVCQCDILSR